MRSGLLTCAAALLVLGACGGKKGANAGKQGTWTKIDYTFEGESITGKLLVSASYVEKQADGTTGVAVFWQIHNTDEKPQGYGWQSKVLLHGDTTLEPKSGSSTKELPKGVTSELQHNIYFLPAGANMSKLRWAFVDDGKVKYSVRLKPKPAPDCKAVGAADKTLQSKDRAEVIENICKLKKFPFGVRGCLVDTAGKVALCCDKAKGCAHPRP